MYMYITVCSLYLYELMYCNVCPAGSGVVLIGGAIIICSCLFH